MPRPHLLRRGVRRGSIRGAAATATGDPRRWGDPRPLAPPERLLPERRLCRPSEKRAESTSARIEAIAMWGEKTDFFENRKGRFWGSGEYTRWGDAAFEAVEEAIDVVLEIVAHHRPLLDWAFHFGRVGGGEISL